MFRHLLDSLFQFRVVWSYIALYVLVIIYANIYFVWVFLSTHLGSLTAFFPIILVGVVLFIGMIILLRKGTSLRLKKRWMAVGVLFVAIALLLPDNNFPAKRIHVAEYLLLSFIVFLLQRQVLTGLSLVIFSALISLLYGAHDEMIQGLLPTRSFGFKDILVDGLSALGGVCIAYAGMDAASTVLQRANKQNVFLGFPVELIEVKQGFYVVVLLFAIQVIIIAINHDLTYTLWASIYTIGVLLAFGFTVFKAQYLWKNYSEGMLVILCLSASLLLYLSSTFFFSSMVFK